MRKFLGGLISKSSLTIFLQSNEFLCCFISGRFSRRSIVVKSVWVIYLFHDGDRFTKLESAEVPFHLLRGHMLAARPHLVSFPFSNLLSPSYTHHPSSIRGILNGGPLLPHLFFLALL